MSSNILIYGSNGYTGELIVERAADEGAKPILAGRSHGKIETQAALRELDFRIFALDDPDAVDTGLKDMTLVINCAGPFSRTAVPMAEACIRTGTHYLDITGEIEVFEALASMGDAAKKADVMLMPGTGFDIVPTDCLAAHLKRRMPAATELILAFKAIGRPSRGTATTMMENIHKGGMIRKDGNLTSVPSAWKIRDFDFGDGPVTAMTIPWGDVSTAFYSTGIPNIQVYMAAPPGLRRMATFSRYFGWLLATSPVQALLRKQIQSGPAGPSDDERNSGESRLYGEAKDDSGAVVRTRLRTPEGYSLTAATSWAIAKKAADGDAAPGFQTPSMVYGADFILDFDGVDRIDLDGSP